MSECKHRRKDGVCLQDLEYVYKVYCVDAPCSCYEPQTNYDRIISKTPEELAEWLAKQEYRKPTFDGWLPLCNHVMGAKICHEYGCKECWLNWLKSPVEVGEE